MGIAADATLIVLVAALSASSPASPSCEPSSTPYTHALPARALDGPDLALVPRATMALAR